LLKIATRRSSTASRKKPNRNASISRRQRIVQDVNETRP
jgi:hypothetical protein